MSVILEPYSTKEFNKLPSLEESRDAFAAHNGYNMVYGNLKQLFLKHNVQNTFGVQLLHSHFDLDQNQRLVEFNNTATAWNIESDEMMGGKIVATSWVIHNDNLMAYEFGFLRMDTQKAYDPTHDTFQAFAKEFISILKAAGLERVLGLLTRPEGVAEGFEFTPGKANIFLPGKHAYDSVKYPAEVAAGWVAGWFFNSEDDSEISKRSCWPFNDSKHDKKGPIEGVCDAADVTQIPDMKDPSETHAEVTTRFCQPHTETSHLKKGCQGAVIDTGVTTRSCWPWTENTHDKK